MLDENALVLKGRIQGFERTENDDERKIKIEVRGQAGRPYFYLIFHDELYRSDSYYLGQKIEIILLVKDDRPRAMQEMTIDKKETPKTIPER